MIDGLGNDIDPNQIITGRPAPRFRQQANLSYHSEIKQFATGTFLLQVVCKGCSVKISVNKDLYFRMAALLCFAVGIFGVRMFAPGKDVPAAFFIKPTRSQETLAQDRDLSQYAVRSDIYDCIGPGDEESRSCRRLRAEAMRFLFDSWHAKHASYAVVHHYCVDCMPVSHIFIERRDTWQITIRRDECAANRAYPTFEKCISETVAYGLKWRKATSEDVGFRRGERMLVFLDKNGREVYSF